MKTLLYAGLAASLFVSVASSQELLVSGFLEFETYGLQDVDADSAIPEVDAALDGRLNLDYGNGTKAGLSYGMHMELDFFQSDDDVDGENVLDNADLVAGDSVEFNDGYVYINSSLGDVSLGDTGTAGRAANQLRVPMLPLGALEVDDYSDLELEQAFYANSYSGLALEASVDDDANWSVGAEYSAPMGPWDVRVGGSINEDGGAGSVSLGLGDLTAGVHMAGTSANVAAAGVINTATTYVSMGVDYDLGVLKLGVGGESQVSYLYTFATATKSKDTINNFFAGAVYEMVDGLELGMGVGVLDADSAFATGGADTVSGKASVTVHF